MHRSRFVSAISFLLLACLASWACLSCFTSVQAAASHEQGRIPSLVVASCTAKGESRPRARDRFGEFVNAWDGLPAVDSENLKTEGDGRSVTGRSYAHSMPAAKA